MIPKFHPRFCSQTKFNSTIGIFSWLLQHFSLSISDGVIQRVCFIGGQIPTSRLEQKSPNFYFVHHMSTTNFEIWICFFSTRWNFSIEIKINKKSQSNHLFHSKKPICNSLKISKEEFHEKIVIQAFLDLRC